MSEDVFVSEQEWREHFPGWVVVDCIVRSKQRVSVMLRQALDDDVDLSMMHDHDIETKAVQLQLDRSLSEPRVYTGGHVEEFNRPVLGLSLRPIPQHLIVAKNNKGTVFAAGGGQAELEYISPEGLVPMTERIVCIDGFAYSVGGVREIYKRVAVGQWEQFNSAGLPDSSYRGKTRAYMGFNDMDGPDESLLYAVGGHGDVHRYDGRRWHRCDFPSNEQLGTVTVAPDGRVYITGEGGNLWVGEKDTWQQTHRGGSSELYNDSVWFNDQLWLCSDYYLRVLEGDQLVRPRFGKQDIHLSGHMDARDGLLVVAAGGRVDVFDGERWQCLVQPYR